jgi:hypothetical protein
VLREGKNRIAAGCRSHTYCYGKLIENNSIVHNSGGSGLQPRNVHGAIFSFPRLAFGQKMTVLKPVTLLVKNLKIDSCFILDLSSGYIFV